LSHREAHVLHILLCKLFYYFKIDQVFFSPDGTIAVGITSGAFFGYLEPGFMWCLPWTESKYLVSKQDFVYESPQNEVVTRDNIKINIALSLLVCIIEKDPYIQ